MSLRFTLPRPLMAAAAIAALALPALADPDPAAEAKELGALMVRMDRGKRNLDKVKKLRVEALQLSSLKKALLSLKRTRTMLRGREGVAFEALASEADVLLARTYNVKTRVHLARGELDKAREANDAALTVSADDKTARALETEIGKELEKLAPPPEELLPQTDRALADAPYYDDYDEPYGLEVYSVYGAYGYGCGPGLYPYPVSTSGYRVSRRSVRHRGFRISRSRGTGGRGAIARAGKSRRSTDAHRRRGLTASEKRFGTQTRRAAGFQLNPSPSRGNLSPGATSFRLNPRPSTGRRGTITRGLGGGTGGRFGSTGIPGGTGTYHR